MTAATRVTRRAEPVALKALAVLASSPVVTEGGTAYAATRVLTADPEGAGVRLTPGATT